MRLSRGVTPIQIGKATIVHHREHREMMIGEQAQRKMMAGAQARASELHRANLKMMAGEHLLLRATPFRKTQEMVTGIPQPRAQQLSQGTSQPNIPLPMIGEPHRAALHHPMEVGDQAAISSPGAVEIVNSHLEAAASFVCLQEESAPSSVAVDPKSKSCRTEAEPESR